MPVDAPLDDLAARWAAGPEAGVFAPLADGLRKRGDLEAAARVIAEGLALFPGHVTGLVVQARIALDRGDSATAEQALADALARDPEHPVARELATTMATSTDDTDDLDALVFTDGPGGEDGDEGPHPGAGPRHPAAELVTESLAALYHRQGHLEAALAAYAELASRDPANRVLVARHEAVRLELAASQPLPFDARESGGRDVASWLAAVAAARPPAVPRPASFDEFFTTPAGSAASPPRPDPGTDFDAFKRWLEDLAR